MSQFWKKVITSGSGISSKRITGIACIVFAMLFAIAGLILGQLGEIDGMVSTVIIEFLTAGVALFGVTALEKRNTPQCNTYQDYKKEESKQEPCDCDIKKEEYIDDNGIIREK